MAPRVMRFEARTPTSVIITTVITSPNPGMPKRSRRSHSSSFVTTHATLASVMATGATSTRPRAK